MWLTNRPSWDTICFPDGLQMYRNPSATMENAMKDGTIRARTETWLKEEVEAIFKELGMTPTEAINLFYNQVRLYRGLPFHVLIPSEETAQVLRDTDEGRNLVRYETMEDMFEDLNR